MKKILAVFLAAILMLSMLPTLVLAVTTPSIEIDSAYGKPGEYVDVNVKIKNNPGIIAATLTFSFDSNLTLVKAENGDAFSALSYTAPNQLVNGGQITSSCRFFWQADDIADENIRDGIILTLTFEISKDAKVGEAYNISVSTKSGDVIDKNINEYNLSATTSVAMLDYTPGDVNDDGRINSIDVVMLSRYIVDDCKFDADGYAVSINENAGNVNDDGRINSIDVVMLSRFIVDGCKYDPNGYGVTIKPVSKKCNHSMTATELQNATCEKDGNIAYWYCSECGKYFRDADGRNEILYEDTIIKSFGHTVVVDPAVAPTYDTWGKTEGSHCSVCNKTIVKQNDIEPLKKTEYTITYEAQTDDYLKTVDFSSQISDDNRRYTSEDGIYELPYLTTDGYDFIGWFDGTSSFATQITEIPVGSKGNKTLYAKWEEKEYRITFAIETEIGESEAPRIHTISKDTELPTAADMAYSGYRWLGWSDENGNLYNGVYPKGKAGDITLHANWQSERNQAIANTNTSEFKVFVDEDAKTYNFTFDLGQIKNVPLHVVTDYGYLVAGSPSTEKETHKADTIKNETAQTIGNTVSSATTTSTSWVLSNEWNKGSSISESHAEDESIDISVVDYNFDSNSSNISISSNRGASTNETVNWGLNAKVYGKNTTTTGAELSAEFPVKVVDVGVKVSAENKTEIGGELGGYYDKTTVNDSYWNTAGSYNNSRTHVQSKTTSQSMSSHVYDSYGYTSHSNYGGSQTEGETYEQSAAEEKEYSSAVAYKTEKLDSVTEKTTYTADTTGYWRQLIVGTVRVIGVVTYDIATCTYSVSTYSIVEDETYEYMDYSITADRDKYVNGVLPLTVPIEIREYINNALGYSNGIYVDVETGEVTGYNGEDKHFHIPDFFNISNGTGDNVSYTPVKVTGIAQIPERDDNGSVIGYKSPFEDNTNIASIRFGNYISKVPADTFKGCSSLAYFESNDLTSIGDNAFAGCSSLEKLKVDTTVTELGTNAFAKVQNVEVYAYDSDVVKNAVISGAKSVSIYLRYMIDELKDAVLIVPHATEEFLINGRNKDEVPVEYSNVRIVSNSNSTEVNGMEFVNNSGIPLKFASENVTLSRVKVTSSPGLAVFLTADTTNLYLDGRSTLSTDGEISVLCHDIVIDRAPYSNSATSLTAESGKLRYVQSFTDENNLYIGSKEQIAEEEFQKYLAGVFTVSFDANGGTVGMPTKEAYYDTAIGDLPVPKRDYYTFDGWYTSPTDGTKVIETTKMTADSNLTLYAHWTKNATSGWVLESDVPAGAEVVNTKWTYTNTETTTSTASSLDGWTQISNEWKKTGSGHFEYAYFPSGYDTGNWIYTSMQKGPASAYDNGSTKREVSNSWTGYVYWHWMYNVGYANVTNRSISSKYGSYFNGTATYSYQYFSAFKSSVNCPYLDNLYCCSQNVASYNCANVIPNDVKNALGSGTPRYFRFDYWTSYYTDYQKYYNYQKITNGESSTEVVNGGQISNAQKWVQYIVK